MILAVTGGKGGVGKTTVAYNLAAELDAVAVDADLGMADLPAARGPDLHDVLAGRADPVEAVREESPVTILPCGRTLAGARAVDPIELVSAIEAVASAYGTVVVDCPAGMGADVGLSLVAAEACVLVTTPDEAALANAIRARALARELDAGLAGIVLNRVTDSDAHDRLVTEFGAPVTEIPESAPLARAQSNALPVCHAAPESTAAQRVRAIADAIQLSLTA